MSETDRMLGAFEEFKKWEEKAHEKLDDKLEKIESKLDALRLWRASVVGMSALAGAASGFLMNWLKN